MHIEARLLNGSLSLINCAMNIAGPLIVLISYWFISSLGDEQTYEVFKLRKSLLSGVHLLVHLVLFRLFHRLRLFNLYRLCWPNYRPCNWPRLLLMR